jgi:hypothetical protein
MTDDEDTDDQEIAQISVGDQTLTLVSGEHVPFTTWADLELLGPESGEHGYRRGYRDGWIVALERLPEAQARMGRVRGYNRMIDHAEWVLLEWLRRCRDGYDTKPRNMEPPPAVSLVDEYAAYINSAPWKAKRRAAILKAGRQCEQCGNSHRLEVHHLTYERFKNEAPEDLVVLCRECHQATHGNGDDNDA